MFFHPSTEAPSAQLTATPILYMYARAYEIEVPSPVEWSSVQASRTKQPIKRDTGNSSENGEQSTVSTCLRPLLIKAATTTDQGCDHY